MLRTITLLRYFARRTKSNAQVKIQGVQPTKFTEQELSKLGQASGNQRISVQKAFREKYASKLQQLDDLYKGQPKQTAKKSISDRRKQFHHKQMPKPTPKQQRANPLDMTLQELSSVRLDPQFLPVSYLKQAQKIFHKYGQTKLRDIAANFSQLMTLRYKEQKLDYGQYQNLKFQRLEQKLPTQKQVEQIYLIGQAKLYEQKVHQAQNLRMVDEDPFSPEMSYTQNIAVSYLLNRAPRTYATAVRLMTEIKYKYPTFNPKSFLDFGGGLAAGSCAFTDIFQNTGEVYSVEPAAKMRKLSKYLTEGMPIKHYQSLGQMSTEVKQVDIVYAGYVINQLKPDLVQVYLQALYTKTKNNGFLVLVEYGSPFGARLIYEARKWALQKGMHIAAPCPHHLKCPMAGLKSWCHFDQPSGMFPSNVFGKLPTDQAVRYQKYSYLILQKQQKDEEISQLHKVNSNVTKQWDRILFPLMKRGKHILLSLCTKQGTFEKRITAKSHGPQYKQVKKLRWGDFWRFGKRIPNRYRKQRITGRRLW